MQLLSPTSENTSVVTANTVLASNPMYAETQHRCQGIVNESKHAKTSAISFLARDVIYTSRTYAMMSVSVCLSVMEVHWRIIANLCFKF